MRLEVPVGTLVDDGVRIMSRCGYSCRRVTDGRFVAMTPTPEGNLGDVAHDHIDFLACHRTYQYGLVSVTRSAALVLDSEGRVREVLTRFDSVGP
ncbi:MAG: hypothetical protein KDA75_00885 [Planctomycetaceae bacterium]|nr:hypothetical protein [Planctomycetaceae bacterium]